MRKHLTQKHEIQSKALQARHTALRHLGDANLSTRDANRHIKTLRDADAAHIEAEALADEFECTCCRESFLNENNFVAVEVNQVTAPRGDGQALIKDYPTGKKPYLYFCRGCALLMEIITQKELDSGQREGRFLV